MHDYDHKTIEQKWQHAWRESRIYDAKQGTEGKKYLPLIEFPYPSGAGLHVGHPRPYIALDIIARKRRAEGFNVLYPIGWDAFGLPTENYAIKTGKDPRVVTKENSDTFREQIQSLGISFDWSREINTTDPSYYRFTQWIFLKLYEKGLAYKATSTINWCPKCKIGLANEEVVDGACERCGAMVEKKEKEQWMLKITEYADRLYEDLENVDYIERAKVQQKNWIGPSEGAIIKFQIQSTKSQINQRSKISNSKQEIEVFTTRPDTIFGATYMVVAPEHPVVERLKDSIENWDEVGAYVKEASNKKDIERTAEGKTKTGVKLEGLCAINPANEEEIPIYIADYVLASYGTGAIMAVPAHDERDYAFAEKYTLPVRQVVASHFLKKENIENKRTGVYALIEKDNKYLLQHFSKDDFYWLPGGGVEENESLDEALKRELREETGYTDLNIQNTSIVSFLDTGNLKQELLRNTNVVCKVDLVSDNSTPVSLTEDEIDDGVTSVWLSAEDIVSLSPKCKPERLDLIVEAIKYFKGVPKTNSGTLINSGKFSGMDSEEAKRKITEYVGGEWKTTYKLRDWVFSRQRYWGEPIPMIHCKECGWVAVPEAELPVTLPEVEHYEPTDTGESPLANINEWVNTSCPACGEPARRETDVMPNWAGSSWYYLSYGIFEHLSDPETPSEVLAKEEVREKMRYWQPVDWYNGGMEHTVLHLLYSRFWHKFLFDISVVPTDEPYKKRTSHGLILAEGGEKMSKSKGNVVNPNEIVERFGADTLRVYEMFMGPFDQAIAWSTDGLVGVRRFLERVVALSKKVDKEVVPSRDCERVAHQSIKKVYADIEELKMNTAVSQLMIFLNALVKEKKVGGESFETFLRLLAPFAPHLADELWEGLGHTSSIHLEPILAFDEEKASSEEVTIAVQIMGKVRGEVTTSKGSGQEIVEELARKEENVARYLEVKILQKVIFIPDKIINFVLKSEATDQKPDS